MSTQKVCIQYSTCDLISDVRNCCVEATIWAKAMYMIKSWLKTRKDKVWTSNKFVRKSPSKRWFMMEFKAC